MGDCIDVCRASRGGLSSGNGSEQECRVRFTDNIEVILACRSRGASNCRRMPVSRMATPARSADRTPGMVCSSRTVSVSVASFLSCTVLASIRSVFHAIWYKVLAFRGGQVGQIAIGFLDDLLNASEVVMPCARRGRVRREWHAMHTRLVH